MLRYAIVQALHTGAVRYDQYRYTIYPGRRALARFVHTHGRAGSLVPIWAAPRPHPKRPGGAASWISIIRIIYVTKQNFVTLKENSNEP